MENLNFFITNNVYATIINDKIYFFDLNKNRYYSAPLFCENLPYKGNTLIVSQRLKNIEIANSLVSQGLLTSYFSSANPHPFLSPASTGDLLNIENEVDRSINLKFFIRFLISIKLSSSWIPNLKITELKEKLSLIKNKFPQKKAELRSISSLVRSHEKFRLYYWAPKSCLLDSVSLMLLLTYYGYSSQLIMGVKDEPFEAHCWLQVNETVLNDSLEKVQSFSPIFYI